MIESSRKKLFLVCVLLLIQSFVAKILAYIFYCPVINKFFLIENVQIDVRATTRIKSVDFDSKIVKNIF